MSASSKRLMLLVATVVIVLGVAVAASAASKPSIKLSATSSCKVGASVKASATVSGTDAYEVRIYKKSGSSWSKVVTATRTSTGHYVAYVSASKKGSMQLKAGYVNSSGSVTAWSNVVTVKVK